MNIAVASDDEVNISQHFGRASHYVVLTVEDGKVVERHTRAKAGHQTFAAHEPPKLAPEEKHGYDAGSEVRHESRWVDVRVRDNGKGIPHHLSRRVFLPGYSTKKRGWGLGLAFAKRIVEEYHRGRISVEETMPGMGTTFLISLPVAPRESGEAA